MLGCNYKVTTFFNLQNDIRNHNFKHLTINIYLGNFKFTQKI